MYTPEWGRNTCIYLSHLLLHKQENAAQRQFAFAMHALSNHGLASRQGKSTQPTWVISGVGKKNKRIQKEVKSHIRCLTYTHDVAEQRWKINEIEHS